MLGDTGIVIAVGERSFATFTGRTSVTTAELLVSRQRSSPAITAALWAATPHTPASPKPSPASYTTSLPRTIDAAWVGTPHGGLTWVGSL